MSDTVSKEQHSRRIYSKKIAIDRQVNIAKSYGIEVKNPHRFAKHHAMDCGQPGCMLCGNPRKLWKEKTIQEKKFYGEPMEE